MSSKIIWPPQASLYVRRDIIQHITGMSYEESLLSDLTDTQKAAIHACIEQLKSGTPIARITNKKLFCEHVFHINSHVLEPRPETEMMIEELGKLKLRPNPKLLDLGTGTGCILISALLAHPTAKGVGIDISENALEVARFNAQCHNIECRSSWIQSDWLESLEPQTFDVILRTPYIDRSEELEDVVTQYDPHLALYASNNGLECYQKILEKLDQFCDQHTYIMWEIGYLQESLIRTLLKDWKVIHFLKDFNSHARLVIFQKP